MLKKYQYQYLLGNEFTRLLKPREKHILGFIYPRVYLIILIERPTQTSRITKISMPAKAEKPRVCTVYKKKSLQLQIPMWDIMGA